MSAFRLRHTPLLSRVGADRADTLRTDVEAAQAGWSDAQLLRVDRRNQVLISNGRVVRRAGQVFDDTSAQLVATATALLNWHDNARFSTVDGAVTKPIKGGWARVNAHNRHEEYPRIDPAVICLVHDGHDRAVLARQTVWPERLFSILAGFVEAGESFESCVVREIAEEIGLTVTDVQYLGSQPWPFPRSLMVGFHAVGDPEQSFSFNDGEIAEAQWFTRAEIREALEHGDWSSDSSSRLLLPGSISIAREIVESWAALD